MVEFIGGIFSSVFGTHSILATILISMFPIIELKGSIPIGMSVDYWGSNALSGTQAFIFGLIGSSIVVPFIALLFIPILNWLKRTKLFKKFGNFIDNKVHNHSKEIAEKSENSGKGRSIIKCLLIFGFVAVPLPLTGVWTGTCVAVIIGLNFYQTVISVVLGNVVAGLIITFVCSVFPQITTILSIIFLAIILAIVIVTIIKILCSKDNEKNEDLHED